MNSHNSAEKESESDDVSVEIQSTRDTVLSELYDVIDFARYKSLEDGRIRDPEKERIHLKYLRIMIQVQGERRKMLADKGIIELTECIEQLKQMQHRQHLRSKLDAIERDVGIDTIILNPLTLSNVEPMGVSELLSYDFEHIKDGVVRIQQTGALRARCSNDGDLSDESAGFLNNNTVTYLHLLKLMFFVSMKLQ
jgi:hypothetical protein